MDDHHSAILQKTFHYHYKMNSSMRLCGTNFVHYLLLSYILFKNLTNLLSLNILLFIHQC